MSEQESGVGAGMGLTERETEKDMRWVGKRQEGKRRGGENEEDMRKWPGVRVSKWKWVRVQKGKRECEIT